MEQVEKMTIISRDLALSFSAKSHLLSIENPDFKAL